MLHDALSFINVRAAGERRCWADINESVENGLETRANRPGAV